MGLGVNFRHNTDIHLIGQVFMQTMDSTCRPFTPSHNQHKMMHYNVHEKLPFNSKRFINK